MHYFLRYVGKRTGYELAKFDPDRGGGPLEVYTILGMSCDCPSPRRPCKHIGMVRILKGYINVYYDDQLDKVLQHNLN